MSEMTTTGLREALEANDKKGHYKSDISTVSYPTGITVLDYANGMWMQVKNSKGEDIIVPLLGIPAGSLNSIIGNTGVGKTTMALQIGWNIVRNFKNGMMFLADCEKTAIPQRIYNLLDIDVEEKKFVLLKNDTSIEGVLERFNKVCEVKEAMGKECMYEISDRSLNGKPFLMYEPTVFVIDSLPSFNGREYNTDDLGNNIDQMKAAKDITRFYTNVLDKAWKYNIIFIVVNHIRPNSIMNQYAQPPQGLLMINPQVETLPRGHVAQFFSGTYFRIKTKKSAGYTIDSEGFQGFKCETIVAKSKTNMIGTSFPTTFNTRRGFDPIYSIYEFASELGLVKGRNPYLYIEGFDWKFNRKEFISLFGKNPDFRKGVLEVLRPYFEALLGEKPQISSEETEDDLVGIKYGDISLDF